MPGLALTVKSRLDELTGRLALFERDGDKEPAGDGETLVERIKIDCPYLQIGRRRALGVYTVNVDAYTFVGPYRKVELELEVGRMGRGHLWPFIEFINQQIAEDKAQDFRTFRTGGVKKGLQARSMRWGSYS